MRQDSDYATGYAMPVSRDTVRLERLLPGPIDRLWRYLVDPDLRRTWLGAGAFDLVPGGGIELVFRNSELTRNDDPAPPAYADMAGEVRLTGEVTACDPPHLLAFTWGGQGEVRFELAEAGPKVRLTVTHARVTNDRVKVMVSAGWHGHLDILAARLDDREPDGFWRRHVALEAEYRERLGPEAA